MYRVKLYLGYYPFDQKKYTYEFEFTDIHDFQQQFLKRFGNTSATNRVENDRYTVKLLTWNIKNIKDIPDWGKQVRLDTAWNIEVIYINKDEQNTRTEIYHIKNEK